MKLFTKRAGITINISTEAVVRSIVIVIAAFLILRFVGLIGHQLQLIGVAAFLALALNPAVNWLAQRTKSKSRVRATGIAYIIVLVLLGAFLALVIPPLVRQTANFLEDIPGTISNLKHQDSALSRLVSRYGLEENIDKLSGELAGRIGVVPGALVNTAGKVGSALVSLLTVLVLTFMMLIEGPLWMERFWSLTDSAKRVRRREIARKMYRVVTGYVNGQVLIALIAAIFALVAMFIGSTIAQVSVNAVALAGIIFLFGLIPMIGNTIGAGVVVLVCLFSSVPLAIGMAVYFLLYQQVENITLQPYIQAKSNQLTPLIVFIAAIVGTGFGGILGAFVAIPVAGCIRILLEEKFAERMPTTETVSKSKK